MAPKIDSAILKALSLDATTTSIASHGGSGFASTFKLSSKDTNGKEKLYFVKTGKGKDSEVMFAGTPLPFHCPFSPFYLGEHMSLNALHSSVPSLCPQSHAHGLLSAGTGSFLATDFLNLSPSSSNKPSSELSLAQKLAQLHSTPAPIPDEYEEPQFGFPVPTCCGDTVQDNSYRSSWADFYAECRLRHILKCAEKNNGNDSELSSLVEQTASVIVPRLLRDGHLKSPSGEKIQPVVVHGDLWSGNHGRGSIDQGGIEEVVFDPSSAWAHSEFEFGIMRMFGGFGKGFEREYERYKGKDEPVDEWEDRVLLYELYHHLNHYSIFGGGYKGGAVKIMRSLIKKYGDGN
ncbi:hypothetical protein EG329_007459 [Mollisiaceae sp. DMI_Dod_QoI]|nr:hypothetical protein EG329_007459 [Helotiales sp. DMI_Dod_QoI]